MQFGTEKTTKTIDDNGSTETVQRNYVRGEVVRPVKHYFEFQRRVHTQAEEHAVYLEFSDRVSNDKTILDPMFRIEVPRLGKANGYYNVVMCYMQLEQ